MVSQCELPIDGGCGRSGRPRKSQSYDEYSASAAFLGQQSMLTTGLFFSLVDEVNKS